MLKKLLLALLVVLWALPAVAELVDTAWVRYYNGPAGSGDFPSAVASDWWGNVYVTGYSPGEGTGDDYATIKYTPGGDIVWVRRYNGPGNGNDWAYALALDGENNVYVTGRSEGIGLDGDCATIKYCPNGDTAWVRRYNGPVNGNDWPWSVAVDHSGYVYLTGGSEITANTFACLTIKYRPDGDTAWIRTYRQAGFGWNWAYVVASDEAGNVHVTGRCGTGSISGSDYLTIKYYPDGETAWVRTYNGPADDADYSFDLAIDHVGDVYVTGESCGDSTPENLTIKYDRDGNELWISRIEKCQHIFGEHKVTLDESGNAYVCGMGQAGGEIGWCQYLLVKYCPDGQIDWTRRYGGIHTNAFPYGLGLDIHGDVYVTGYGGPNLTTLKHDSQGSLWWTQEYFTPNLSGWWSGRQLATDYMGNVYVTAPVAGDYSTIKYVQFWYSRGDVNEDEEIDVTDVIYLIDYVLRAGPELTPFLPMGNVNCDAAADLADVVYLVNYVFRDGPKPCP